MLHPSRLYMWIEMRETIFFLSLDPCGAVLISWVNVMPGDVLAATANAVVSGTSSRMVLKTYPVNMPLCTGTELVLARCWQHRPRAGPFLVCLLGTVEECIYPAPHGLNNKTCFVFTINTRHYVSVRYLCIITKFNTSNLERLVDQVGRAL